MASVTSHARSQGQSRRDLEAPALPLMTLAVRKRRLPLWFSRDSVGGLMRRFVEGADRGQWTLLPECLDDFIDESNPVRVIDVFVDALDLAKMSFEGVEPAATGRPSYHPSVLLKLYIYGYLNGVQSSRRPMSR